MTSSEFDAALDALVLASRAVVGIAARTLPEGVDVSLVQLRALVLIERDGQRKAGTLAELLNVSPSTVTGLCDRLTARGLAERSLATDNRREVVVRLTPAGKELVQRTIAARRMEMARVLEMIPASQLRGMVEALTAFAEAAGEGPEQAWSSGWRS